MEQFLVAQEMRYPFHAQIDLSDFSGRSAGRDVRHIPLPFSYRFQAPDRPFVHFSHETRVKARPSAKLLSL
jgi:hypothetical protein